MDFDRPWKGNNVASVAVQMWAKKAANCSPGSRSIRYSDRRRKSSFRREEEWVDCFRPSLNRRESKDETLVGGKWRVDYRFGDDGAGQGEHLCS